MFEQTENDRRRSHVYSMRHHETHVTQPVNQGSVNASLLNAGLTSKKHTFLGGRAMPFHTECHGSNMVVVLAVLVTAQVLSQGQFHVRA